MPRSILFKDISPHCRDPQVVRWLRDLYFSPESRLWSLLLVDGSGLPPEVNRLTVPFEVGWPDEEELPKWPATPSAACSSAACTKSRPGSPSASSKLLVQTLRGLTAEEASRIIAGAVHDDHSLAGADLPRIVDAKRRRLGTTGCLESIIADVPPDDIGGLRHLKRWLNLRRHGFTVRGPRVRPGHSPRRAPAGRAGVRQEPLPR